MTELSVIITSNGKLAPLRACLEALCRQTLSATDFEVIVIVGGSSDRISERLTNLRTSYKLRVLHQGTCGQSVASYRGVEAAVGHYCLFIDDDIVAHPTLLHEHLRVQHQREGVIGIGQILHTLPNDVHAFARYVMQERRDRYSRLNAGQPPSLMDCVNGNLSLPRAEVLKTGGVTPHLSNSGCLELAYLLERQGLSLVYIPNAIGDQDYRKGFREIAADATSEGIAHVALYRQHPPILPRLKLGAFYDMSRASILLRRLLLILGVSPRLVATVGLLSGKRGRIRGRYQFVYHYCYWRGVRRALSDRGTWQRLTRCPLILMYHALGKRGESPGRYVIPRQRFALQMAWLKWNGYHVFSLAEFLRDRYEHLLSPSRSVILTFDDGYADNRTIAYPILRRYGFPATIFLVSGMMGGTNCWDKEGELAGRPLLSWSDVREMVNGGIRFGAHTRNHVPLTLAPLSGVKEEVEESQADLERGLGLPVFAFAYPHGEFNPAIQEVVERAGFLGACSCHTGVNDPVVPRHALRRVEVRGTDSFIHFVLALWLGIPARSHSSGSVSGCVALDPSRNVDPQVETTGVIRSAARGGDTKRVAQMSVAISTLDRPHALARCLDALLAGEAVPAEVIIVDQSQNDATRLIVTQRQANTVPIIYIHQSRRGLSVSRNTAIMRASCPIIAVTDDDCIPDSEWISTIERTFASATAPHALTGRVLPLGSETPNAFAVATRNSTLRTEYRGKALPWLIGGGNNFAVKREWFSGIGGCDERLGVGSPGKAAEDMDLFYRHLRAGARIRYEPDALVYHQRQSKAQRLASRWSYGYGMGAFCSLWLQRGDFYALRILGHWLAWQSWEFAIATGRHRWLETYQQWLSLRGTFSGLMYGFRKQDAI